MSKRLPSFNDFSPVILKGDLRTCLSAIRDGGGDDRKVVATWAQEFFQGVENKRSQTNIPATLRSTGLIADGKPLTLSPFGQEVLDASTALEAAQIFCGGLIKSHNGDVLLSALASLRKRGEPITKELLKSELRLQGIESLATATTDHTTFKNWMVEAQIIDQDCVPNDTLLKKLIGISATELTEWEQLPLAQQIFLEQLRRAHISDAGPFMTKGLLSDCLDSYPDLFDPAQFARQIQKPLVSTGWICVTNVASGKSGRVVGTKKLLDVPIDRVIPDFNAIVPPDLRALISTPLSTIRDDLYSEDAHRGGLALELLALRMILDLGLDPRAFRLRSSQSAHAEVDLVAEGRHLMFSRWTFQCKRHGKHSQSKVRLNDVAKEVGIALYVKAHVVVMVTTTGFSADAKRYADAITGAGPLQFLFVDGSTVDAYLEKGKAVLLQHARNNAGLVMARKRDQPLPEGNAE